MTARLPLRVVVGMVVLGFAAVAGSGTAAAANVAAEGRAAARKAGQLAAQGKCHLAIPQYNKAYEILQDPAILFNRAECLRRIDRDQDALANYQQFLEDLPKAPNHAVVEQRIAELKKKLGLAENGTAPGPAGKPVPPPPPPPKPEPAAIAKPAPPAPPTKPAPVASARPAPSDGVLALGPDQPPPSPNSLDNLNLGSSSPEPAADVSDQAAEKSGVSPWVWVGIGAAVLAAGAVAGFFLLKGNGTDVPKTSLGNYKF